MSKTVISVTGHRLLSDEQKEKIRPVMKRAIENIMFTAREHNPAAEFYALSPLAEGADALFAEIALSLDLPLKVMLPFEKEAYRQTFTTDKARLEFDRIYDDLLPENKAVFGSAKDSDKDDLYLGMGKKMVDGADYVVAVWNEKPGNGKGGAADIVAYAKECGTNILLINPEETHPHINFIHKDHHRRRPEEVIDTTQTNYLLQYISEKLDEYDANAVLFNRKYKRVWTTGFVIGLVELLAFAIIIAFHVSVDLHFILSSVELVSILIIIYLVMFGGAKEFHAKYVHYRIVSERLRIKKFFAEFGLRIYHASVSPIYFSFKEKAEYNILDNTIMLINLSAYSYVPFETRKQQLDEELIIDQYKYHERKKEKFEKKNHLYHKVRKVLFVLFAVSIILHFCHITNEFFLHHKLTTWKPHIFHVPLFEHLVIFLSLFIPATIAASEALKYLYEWEKIISLSSAMATYFKERSRKLKHIHTEEELEVFLNAINKDMLIENLDWEKYMHDKNEVPT